MIRLSVVTAVSALLLAACDGREELPAETPGPEGDQASHSEVETGQGPDEPTRATAEPDSEATATETGADAQAILAEFGAPYTEANLENGRRIFRRCAACHTLEEGARHLVGPNLHGVFGREAGSAANFRYSDALQNADFVWTPQRLDQWLTDPNGFLPGNRMAFPGLREAEDRRDVIAYVAVETHAEPVSQE